MVTDPFLNHHNLQCITPCYLPLMQVLGKSRTRYNGFPAKCGISRTAYASFGLFRPKVLFRPTAVYAKKVANQSYQTYQSPSIDLGRTVSRFLFYPVIYLLDLPPGKERAALLSLRTLRYTWSFWSWCRHRRMSPYGVVSSCLAVSPLPQWGGLFSVTAFIRLLPSVLSTAGCLFQSGLSSV